MLPLQWELSSWLQGGDQVGGSEIWPGFRIVIFLSSSSVGIVLTSPLLWGTIFVAPKEVSLCSLGLNWASLYRGLVQGQLECINVGFVEVHDLREVFKGEEEAIP